MEGVCGARRYFVEKLSESFFYSSNVKNNKVEGRTCLKAQFLWRVRLGLFIVISSIYFLFPIYEGFGDHVFLWWPWGMAYVNGAFQITFVGYGIALIILNSLIPLGLGIAGCVLTKQCVKQNKRISRNAQLFTQFGTMASFVIALLLMANSYSIIDLGRSITSINVNAFFAFPISVLLVYISYDFPHFRAIDFAKDAPVSDNTREKQKIQEEQI